MYISVFYVFYHPFSIKKIGKYDDLDVENFFSPLNQVRFTRIWQKKKKLNSSQLEFNPARVGNTVQLELENLTRFKWKSDSSQKKKYIVFFFFFNAQKYIMRLKLNLFYIFFFFSRIGLFLRVLEYIYNTCIVYIHV